MAEGDVLFPCPEMRTLFQVGRRRPVKGLVPMKERNRDGGVIGWNRGSFTPENSAIKAIKERREMGLARFIATRLFLFVLKYYRPPSRSPRIFCLPGDHIGDYIFIDGMYERELLESIFDGLLLSMKEQFSSGSCLDIGANIGNHTAYFSGRFNRVFAFEPNPIFCSVLRASLALNQIDNVDLFEVGLSDRETELTYYMRDGSLGESKFLNGVDLPDEAEPGRTMSLRVCRGDTILAKNNVTDLALIKIDVEGHELKALMGLRDTIRNNKPIILFESHPESDSVAARRVLELLRYYGYEHIYSYEAPINPFRGAARKIIYRLVMGTRRRLSNIDRSLHEHAYSLLIASPAPLAVSHDCSTTNVRIVQPIHTSAARPKWFTAAREPRPRDTAHLERERERHDVDN